MREMKDSKVKWLGEIPLEWKVERVKHGFVRKKTEAHQDNPIVLSLARTGVRERDISNNEGQIAESYYNYNPVDVDDLLINPMDLYSGANCSISKISGVISPAYVNLRYREGYNPQYYDYYFKLQYWLMAFFAHGKGVSYENRWTLNAETLMNYPIIVPTQCEQRKIVDYLDAKCSKIDEIIERQQAIIEKLKEYKLSIITEAVTKGINPNVEIKDSGIEWIGYIPKCWNISRFKYLSSEIGDGLHSTPVYDSEGDYYFMNGQNIGNEKLVFSDKTDRLNELEYMKYKKPLLSENTIFITLNGATYGKSSFYNGEKVLLGKSAGYITLKSSENKRYIRYYLQSRTAKIFMELSLCGSTIANLSLKTLNEFIIPLPSEDEQRRIVDFLDVRCKLIDHNIDEKGKIVEKLQEYKKSLIYEVVTGKKEV